MNTITISAFNKISKLVDDRYPISNNKDYSFYARQYVRGALYPAMETDDYDEYEYVMELPETDDELRKRLESYKDELFTVFKPPLIEDDERRAEASAEFDQMIAEVMELANGS